MLKKLSVVALGIFAFAGLANAGVITDWDMTNVTVTPPPYTEFETYPSILFTDATKAAYNGVITWKESDVQAPGLKVVNGDDQDGSNCLMTTGYNPVDFSDKMCSDDLKFSKRWKVKAYHNNVVDVQFTVADGAKTTYRSLQKITDGTEVPWEGFRAELGFIVNSQFIQSTSGDGLGFSDTRGKYLTSTTSYQQKEDTLSALFAHGLAGSPDKYHDEAGYFDPNQRMEYEFLATEDSLQTGALSSNYTDVVGPWNNSEGVPFAYFYDDDQDPNTDNILMANCEGPYTVINPDTEEIICDGQWVTYRSEEGLDANGVPFESDGVAKPVSAALLAAWQADPWMNTGAIEDLANLGLNYWITVDDNTAWPTPNQFVIRFYPQPVEAPVDPEICDDTIDNDGDGAVDCLDSDCAVDPACAAPTPEICDDSLDNDQDGAVDCDDADCSADAACQTPAAEICTDGIDNDGDSYADCADPDCEGIAGCGPEGKFETCSDGFDNDGDSEIDCADSGCARNKSCR